MLETQTAPDTLAAGQGENTQKRSYVTAAGYLRAALTVLVVAHHSFLAYASFTPPPPQSLSVQPRLWLAFPVSDKVRWPGFDLVIGFDDIFFMSALFFLSGLFAWQSLEHRGVCSFLLSRLKRLGIPYLFAVMVIAPLGYLPSYLQSVNHAGLSAFLKQYGSLGFLPTGPAWFVLLLLFFDGAVALAALGRTRIVAIGRWLPDPSQHPVRLFGLLGSASLCAYVPMALMFGSLSWTTIGPFTFQTSRLFHYAVYFFFALCLGATTTQGGTRLWMREGKLARHWLRWLAAAFLTFASATLVTIALSTLGAPAATWISLLASVLFVLSSAASTFGCLALFARFAGRSNCLWESLRSNAYGIYLVHYAFVSWLQYVLLPVQLGALSKGVSVLCCALGLSWLTTSAFRRVRTVKTILG